MKELNRMPETIIEHVYHLKGGVQAALEYENPKLDRREPVVVFCDDGITRLKIGDGTTRYNDLPYVGGNNSQPVNIVVDSRLDLESSNPVMNKVITKELYNKVDKVFGKDLSTNDFTNDLKTKLDSIEEGATRVEVDTINLDALSTNAVSNSLVTQVVQDMKNNFDNLSASIDETVVEILPDIVNDHLSSDNIILDGGQI